MNLINLQDGLLGEKINIAVVQLESPFYSELDLGLSLKGDDIFSWKGRMALEARKKKIISISEQIKKVRDNINVIAFPEYSVPSDCLPILKEFADENDIIIVAGTDQVRNPNEENYRKNVCPVIIPHEKVYFVKKEHISDNEVDVVKGGDNEESTLKLYWTHDQKDMCLQIFVCLDYLENHDKIDRTRRGGVVVPMCTPQMNSFEGYTDFDIRHGGGKFIIFANAITLNKQEKFIAKGRSAIYGASGERDNLNAVISLSNGIEGVLITELNFGSPFHAMPSRVREPPVTFKKKYKIVFNELLSSYELEPLEPLLQDIQRAGVINPDIFYRFRDQRLNFIFLLTREYMRVKGEFHFGFEIEELRKKIAIAKIIENMDRWPYITARNIGDIYKFYGYEPKKVELSLQEVEDKNLLTKVFTLSRNWDTPEISEDEKVQILKKGLILGLYNKVNLRKERKIRAFTTVVLHGGDTRQAAFFERNIIGDLKERDGVVSIYKTSSSADLPCNYLVDIIDDPYSLFEIVEDIHEMCKGLYIEVSTRTHIIVDQLSLGLFKQLLTKEMNHRQRMLLEELNERGLEISPTDISDAIVERYLRFKEQITDIRKNDNAIEMLNSAIYPTIASIITNKIRYYRDAFTLLLEFVEVSLRKMLGEKIKSKYGTNPKDFNVAQNDLSLARKEVWKFTLHELIDAHKKWNSKYPNEIIISNESLEKIGDRNVVEIRNHFAHGRTKQIKNDEVGGAIQYLFDFISKDLDVNI
jgi:predicted amidohydrolase